MNTSAITPRAQLPSFTHRQLSYRNNETYTDPSPTFTDMLQIFIVSFYHFSDLSFLIDAQVDLIGAQARLDMGE
jgi:hypothetical protein